MSKSFGFGISLLCVVCLSFGSGRVQAQTPIEAFLNRVESHSFQMEAGRAEADARIAETRSNNAPPDPEAEYGITRGIEDTKGHKITYGISQGIAWPGEYAARSKYNRLERQQAETQFQSDRQEFLLRVKLLCYDIVHAHKRQEILNRQLADAERVLSLTQKSLEQGDVTAFDLSHARLHLTTTRAAWLEGSNDLAVKREQLILLTGIDDFDTAEFAYLERPDENLDDLLSQARAEAMTIRLAQLESDKSRRNVSIVRGSTLPSFSVGVTGERLTSEDSFVGPMIGVSIPLWGGSGQVKTARARQTADELYARTVQADTESQLIELAGNARRLRESLTLYDSLKDVREGARLLDRSFELEEITALDYFDRLLFYYQTEQEYLALELELFRTLAELAKVRL